MKTTQYVRHERAIAATELAGIRERWRWGRRLLADSDAMSSDRSLKHGVADQLIAAAAATGLRLHPQEIQRRLQLARIYTTEQAVDEIVEKFGSWSALFDAEFPPMLDDLDLDDLDAVDEQPDEFRSKSIRLPGFKETLRLRGEAIDLADATVGDLVAYRDKYRHMHEGFGKTLDLIEATVTAVLDGADGDLDANAVEAYERGAGLPDETEAAA